MSRNPINTTTASDNPTTISNTFFREFFPLLSSCTIDGTDFYELLSGSTDQSIRKLKEEIAMNVTMRVKPQDNSGVLTYDKGVFDLLSHAYFKPFFSVSIDEEQTHIILSPTKMMKDIIKHTYSNEQTEQAAALYQNDLNMLMIDTNTKLELNSAMNQFILYGRFRATDVSDPVKPVTAFSNWQQLPLTEPKEGYAAYWASLVVSSPKPTETAAIAKRNMTTPRPAVVNVGCTASLKPALATPVTTTPQPPKRPTFFDRVSTLFGGHNINRQSPAVPRRESPQTPTRQQMGHSMKLY